MHQGSKMNNTGNQCKKRKYRRVSYALVNRFATGECGVCKKPISQWKNLPRHYAAKHPEIYWQYHSTGQLIDDVASEVAKKKCHKRQAASAAEGSAATMVAEVQCDEELHLEKVGSAVCQADILKVIEEFPLLKKDVDKLKHQMFELREGTAERSDRVTALEKKYPWFASKDGGKDGPLGFCLSCTRFADCIARERGGNRAMHWTRGVPIRLGVRARVLRHEASSLHQKYADKAQRPSQTLSTTLPVPKKKHDGLMREVLEVARHRTALCREPAAAPPKEPAVQPSGEPLAPPTGQPALLPTEEPAVPPTFGLAVSSPEELAAPLSEEPAAHPPDGPAAPSPEEPAAPPIGKGHAAPSPGEPAAPPSEEPAAHPPDDPAAPSPEEPAAPPIGKGPAAPSPGKPAASPSEEPATSSTSDPAVPPIKEPAAQPTKEPEAQPQGEPATELPEEPTAPPTGEPAVSSSSQESAVVSCEEPGATSPGKPSSEEPGTVSPVRPVSARPVLPTSAPRAQQERAAKRYCSGIWTDPDGKRRRVQQTGVPVVPAATWLRLKIFAVAEGVTPVEAITLLLDRVSTGTCQARLTAHGTDVGQPRKGEATPTTTSALRTDSVGKQHQEKQADFPASRFVLPTATWLRLQTFAAAEGVTPVEAIALLLDRVSTGTSQLRITAHCAEMGTSCPGEATPTAASTLRTGSVGKQRQEKQADVPASRFVLPTATWLRLQTFATAEGVTPVEAIALLLDRVSAGASQAHVTAHGDETGTSCPGEGTSTAASNPRTDPDGKRRRVQQAGVPVVPKTTWARLQTFAAGEGVTPMEAIAVLLDRVSTGTSRAPVTPHGAEVRQPCPGEATPTTAPTPRTDMDRERCEEKQADVPAPRFVLRTATWIKLRAFATAEGVTPMEAIAVLLDRVSTATSRAPVVTAHGAEAVPPCPGEATSSAASSRREASGGTDMEENACPVASYILPGELPDLKPELTLPKSRGDPQDPRAVSTSTDATTDLKPELTTSGVKKEQRDPLETSLADDPLEVTPDLPSLKVKDEQEDSLETISSLAGD